MIIVHRKIKVVFLVDKATRHGKPSVLLVLIGCLVLLRFQPRVDQPKEDLAQNWTRMKWKLENEGMLKIIRRKSSKQKWLKRARRMRRSQRKPRRPILDPVRTHHLALGGTPRVENGA
ncbi:hypothetical protein PIB30_027036 [Stylosanthes scabra]|uniref:Uncharacterized protein n=1 Tax=Stylosanthes scabra TaxID=79078 RepID=A0ABU6RAS1_9FABA|nr:hypothetical protein [Stylosanthes scabra]